MNADEHYRELFDSAPDALVVVGATGTIEVVNLQAERLFGYGRGALVGQSLAVLIPERLRDQHEGEVSRFLASAETRTMGAGRQLVGRHRDGTELPIEVNVSPCRGERGPTVTAAIRDTRERTQSEAPAKLIAGRLASAVESIQDAVALFDDTNRLVLCNSVYRMLIGDSLQGPLVGRSYEQLLDAWIGDIAFEDESARARFRGSRLEQRARREPTSLDIRMRDGRTLRVIDRQTADGGIVKTIWDLTADVRLGEEVREARGAAEAASRAKSDFLSSMSHELRTPMNAILGFAQLLQRDKKEPLSDRHKERVAHILQGGEHLLRLIDDVLDLSRIEAGTVSVSTEPVRVTDVLEEVASTLESMAARTGIAVEVGRVPPDLPMVSADRTRFVQILTNFGSNAIKYNRPGGRVIFTVATTVPGRLRVTVGDTGPGIPVESQGKLFQPFQRAGQETGPIEGTGIGLVISKRLAELMHGEVGFRSVVGEGSEFWVDLRVHASTLPSAPKHSRGPSTVRAKGNGPRLVLYVEDNSANVDFMMDLVGTFGDIELLVAPTAEIGIELARARRPDAIIMDINLPGMSGLDALRALRELPETKTIPVVGLSAAASERDRQRATQAGFYRYLTKPVKVDELIDTLEEVFLAASARRPALLP
ncbi:MAG: hypothetical protein JWP97_2781 [Labilithrix sp.]|nr:hypothetical protein [Labilithrix sp.]